MVARLYARLAGLLGWFGVVAPLLPTFIPRLPPGLFYARLDTLRRVARAAGFALALIPFVQRPSWRRFTPVLNAGWLAVLSTVAHPKRVLVALDDPPHVAAEAARVGDRAPVVGVALDGQARAWPLEILIPRHVVNDRLGETPLLVGYCAACRSALVYAATVNGQRLTFEVAGVWRRNLVLRDRATGSIWQQATGEAIAGPLQGTRLHLVGGEQMEWRGWRSEYPQTTAAVEAADAPRSPLPHSLLTRLFDLVTPRIAVPGLRPVGSALPAHEDIIGLRVGGEARAYPLSLVQTVRVINDNLGGEPVVLVYEHRGDQARAFVRKTRAGPVTLLGLRGVLSNPPGTLQWDRQGQPLRGTDEPLQAVPVSRQWWLGWSEFHPATTVYQPDGSARPGV